MVVPAWLARTAMRLAAVVFALGSLARADEARFEVPEDTPPGVVVSAKLIVSASAGMTTFHLPTVDGIEFSNRVQQRGVSIMNGRREDWVGVEVRAAAIGDYTIPPITVDLDDGSSLKTAPVVLHVKAADEHLTGVAVAEASFDPPTIVPGETTHLIYKLSVQQGVRPLDISFAPPEDAVRLSQEAKQQSHVTLDAKGNQWQIFTLTWDVTYNEPGEHVVDGQQELAMPGDFFDQRRETIAVHPARLMVAAIPSQGQPADFDGLIGPLQIQARLASTQITTDEGSVLSLRVTGPQATHMHPPRLLLPPGLRCYAMDPLDEGGQRTFRWDITASAPGEYTIPSFSLPYFNPSPAAFARAHSEPLQLSVAPGQRVTPPLPSESPDTRSTVSAPLAFRDSPLRLHAWRDPAPTLVPWMLGIGLLAGATAGVVPGALRRLRQRERPGRALAVAVAAGSLDAAAAALERVRIAVRDPQLAAAAECLRLQLDLARFGSQPLSAEALTLVRQLEGA